MNIFEKLNPLLLNRNSVPKVKNPEAAYDLWADDYDSQPDNMMLAWDEKIVTELLEKIPLKDKIIADIGCGTGRHWEKIISRKPKKLIGFDVSEGMLKILQQKFPQAVTYHLINDQLEELENSSCDLVFSTLTIAHIENAEKALHEWNRILKAGGGMIITDYHPTALANGGKRTFNHNGKTIAVKNYIHSIEQIRSIAKQLQLTELRLLEKSIDESAKPFYEKQNSLSVYEAWKGTPIIYGIQLKKPDAAL